MKSEIRIFLLKNSAPPLHPFDLDQDNASVVKLEIRNWNLSAGLCEGFGILNLPHPEGRERPGRWPVEVSSFPQLESWG